MSPVLKCILGLFVVLCSVQFIEMSRIRRDDAVTDATDNLKNAVETLVNKLKGALDDDTVKKLMDAASQTFTEGAKLAQEQLSKLGTNIGNAASSAGAAGGAGH